MKVLNLYSGIGGNRKLWEGVEVTAVEKDPYVAQVYQSLFPNDTVVVDDAHDYLLKHYMDFDFIWSSPPCPTHSKTNLSLIGYGIVRYPEMSLYQEIIFLKQFYRGKWVVENVKPYYEPLITPNADIDRHLFWSNMTIPTMLIERNYNIANANKEALSSYHNITLPEGTKGVRKMLRNAVNPLIGLNLLEQAQGIIRDNNSNQQTLFRA